MEGAESVHGVRWLFWHLNFHIVSLVGVRDDGGGKRGRISLCSSFIDR